jgi:hypothetical protein
MKKIFLEALKKQEMSSGFFRIDPGISSVLNFKPVLPLGYEPEMRIAFP